MFNCSCSINTIVAWSAWILGVIGGVLSIAVSADLRVVAILLAAAGATLHVRGFIYGLEARERAAFRLGQESAAVRAVH